MPRPNAADLSRRERQIMSIVYQLGRATAADVLGELEDPPSYSAVRSHLRILEEKGHLRHEQDGPRYVFLPTLPRDRARLGALRQVLHTFFDGSASQAMAALLDSTDRPLSPQELDQLARLVEHARKEGR
ncbi:MAG TPA: BlaI/MecI/CopY family transcriptional regulator [Gemmatimonadales bacterium]|jgi:predicted transcriptional regulator|nr:BlaI/MecI/CopY family transcriptional regulator [Gemmatimonadales bacterium]